MHNFSQRKVYRHLSIEQGFFLLLQLFQVPNFVVGKPIIFPLIKYSSEKRKSRSLNFVLVGKTNSQLPLSILPVFPSIDFGRVMTTSSLFLKTHNSVTKCYKEFLCLLRDGSRYKCKCSKGKKGRIRRMGNREDRKLYSTGQWKLFWRVLKGDQL